MKVRLSLVLGSFSMIAVWVAFVVLVPPLSIESVGWYTMFNGFNGMMVGWFVHDSTEWIVAHLGKKNGTSDGSG